MDLKAVIPKGIERNDVQRLETQLEVWERKGRRETARRAAHGLYAGMKRKKTIPLTPEVREKIALILERFGFIAQAAKTRDMQVWKMQTLKSLLREGGESISFFAIPESSEERAGFAQAIAKYIEQNPQLVAAAEKRFEQGDDSRRFMRTIPPASKRARPAGMYDGLLKSYAHPQERTRARPVDLDEGIGPEKIIIQRPVSRKGEEDSREGQKSQ